EVIVAPGGEPLTVRAEGDGEDRVIVGAEGASQPAGAPVPELDLAAASGFTAPGGEERPVGAERHAVRRAPDAGQPRANSAPRRVKQENLAVAARRQRRAVRAEGEGGDLARDSRRRRQADCG